MACKDIYGRRGRVNVVGVVSRWVGRLIENGNVNFWKTESNYQNYTSGKSHRPFVLYIASQNDSLSYLFS